MPAQDDPTVYLVDDDEAARASLEALLTASGWPCAAFPSAESFLAALPPSPRGCVVTDLRLEHGMSGEQLHRALRARDIRLPVIVISGYATTPVAVRMMRDGAWTLLEKPCSRDELIEAVAQAMEHDEHQRRLAAIREAFRSRLESLSDEEKRTLDGMLRGWSNKVIGERYLWGLRTVEAYRHRVLKKMNVPSVVELARQAALAGYRDDAEPRRGTSESV